MLSEILSVDMKSYTIVVYYYAVDVAKSFNEHPVVAYLWFLIRIHVDSYV